MGNRFDRHFAHDYPVIQSGEQKHILLLLCIMSRVYISTLLSFVTPS
jgi:hypothetical protein